MVWSLLSFGHKRTDCVNNTCKNRLWLVRQPGAVSSFGIKHKAVFFFAVNTQVDTFEKAGSDESSSDKKQYQKAKNVTICIFIYLIQNFKNFLRKLVAQVLVKQVSFVI